MSSIENLESAHTGVADALEKVASATGTFSEIQEWLEGVVGMLAAAGVKHESQSKALEHVQTANGDLAFVHSSVQDAQTALGGIESA